MDEGDDVVLAAAYAAGAAALVQAWTLTVVLAGSVRKPRRRSSSRRRDRSSFERVHRVLNDADFQRAFRMPRGVFALLLETLGGSLKKDSDMARRSSGGVIEPAVRLALTLRLLSGASYHDIMMLFSIGRSTAFTVFHKTTHAIMSHLHMPGVPLSDPVLLHRLAEGFASSRAPPSPIWGCIGALDGIAIRVLKPKDKYFPRNFYCRKGFYALSVQAVVDSSYRFLYSSARCVGSTHDSVAFGASSLGASLKEGKLMSGYWIAGDAAFECSNSVVTPWSLAQLADDELGRARDAFNFFQSSLRMHVEQAFGILVARFGILWSPIRFALPRAPVIVAACMRLHNFCIDNGAPSVLTALPTRDRASLDRAFDEWWQAAAGARDVCGRYQGRRRDLESSDVREHLTRALHERGLFRPV